MALFKGVTISLYQHVFDLRRADPVAAHVDDIIEAPGDLVVTLLGAMGAVTREIVTCRHAHTHTHKQAGIGGDVHESLVRGWKEVGSGPTRKRLEVGLDEPLVVVVDSAGHAGPGLGDAQGP